MQILKKYKYVIISLLIYTISVALGMQFFINTQNAKKTQNLTHNIINPQDEESPELEAPQYQYNNENEIPKNWLPQAGFPSEAVKDPYSIAVLVNKENSLEPLDFSPSDLTVFNNKIMRSSIISPLEQIFANIDFELTIISAYRSYEYQQEVYQGYVYGMGQEQADEISARPGFSEHQTGLAIDFGGIEGCTLQTCFEHTTAGTWLSNNAHNFGFILRYPKGYEHITGYSYEPWHFRYVGIEIATMMKNLGIQTYEEFLRL